MFKSTRSTPNITVNSGNSKAETNWVRQPLYGAEMALDLPGKPNEIPFDISAMPSQIRDVMKEMKGYEYTQNDLVVIVTYGQYVDGFIASPEGGAKGSLEDMKKQKPDGNLKYKIDNRDPTNIIISGSVNWIENTPFDINGFGKVKGEKSWLLFCYQQKRKCRSQIIF